MNTLYKIRNYGLFLMCGFLVIGCDEFLKIDPPRTDLVRATIFATDATADAAVVDIYYQMAVTGFANGSSNGVGYYGSLSSDEVTQNATGSIAEFHQFNDNALLANNFLVTNLWSNIYKTVYRANAIIEGLAASTEVSENLKNQLTGEAKFVRAFCHFHAVNLWGDVPLIVTTDYKTNNSILRSAKALVYQQIEADLKDAQRLLTDDYSFSNNERVRANKGAATALLARVYLFTEDWINAETEATRLIDNTSQYSLETDLRRVFQTKSKEAVFQLWTQKYPNEVVTFAFNTVTGPLNGTLRPGFVDGFEPGDQRTITWIKPASLGGIIYYQAFKYQSNAMPPEDYSTVFRLAEQYLIRAEARAQQNKFSDSAGDINIIRNRAGLANTTSATNAELMDDVMQERRSELFTEWGHRWFDLKRTGKADVVLGPIKPEWNANDVLYPIPEVQLISNPAMTQNPN